MPILVESADDDHESASFQMEDSGLVLSTLEIFQDHQTSHLLLSDTLPYASQCVCEIFLSPHVTATVLSRCHVGHRASLSLRFAVFLTIPWVQNPVLLSFKHIPITLQPWPWPVDFSQRTMWLISLKCTSPHRVGRLTSLGRKKVLIMHSCPFCNLFIQTSRLLLLFKINFLEFYSMLGSCQ